MAEPKTKTALFVNKQKGGMFAVEDQSLSTGNRWFVDSGKTTLGADTANKGRSPNTPFLTLDYAESQATANNHDIIYLMAGHAESLIAPITLTKEGITVIGLGQGDDRPTFTAITNATASISMIAANGSSIKNCRFVCNIANQTEAIDIASDDVEIGFCDILEGSAVPLSLITADTADGDSDGLHIHDCFMHVPTAGAGNQAIEIAKDMANIVIEDNIIRGDFDEACIEVPAGGDACVNLMILNNQLQNLLTGQHAIQISGTGVTGRIVGNECQTDTQAATIDKSACYASRNFWLDADGTNDEEAVPVNAAVASATATSPGLGGIDDTTTDTINGKIGTDTEMADSSLFDMLTTALTTSGKAIVITKTITSSSIPDDGGGSPLSAALTGAASGSLILEEIIMQTDSTGLAGTTTTQVVCDNAKGLTGATVPIWDEATANLGANATINNDLADVNNLPIVLETTKKLYINADDTDGTGGGTVDVTMKFRRITAGATIAAA